MSDVPPPSVPADALSDWRRVEASVDTPFDARIVTVRAHTVLYEERPVERRVRGDVDRPRRFFFASRLRLTPTPRRSRALDGLVTDRARRAFADRLRQRGLDAVRDVEHRSLAVGDAEAALTRYDAVCRTEGASYRVDGWMAAWPTGDEYLLAGGAYPREILDGAACEALDPAAYRTELLRLIRKTGESAAHGGAQRRE